MYLCTKGFKLQNFSIRNVNKKCYLMKKNASRKIEKKTAKSFFLSEVSQNEQRYCLPSSIIMKEGSIKETSKLRGPETYTLFRFAIGYSYSRPFRMKKGKFAYLTIPLTSCNPTYVKRIRYCCYVTLLL